MRKLAKGSILKNVRHQYHGLDVIVIVEIIDDKNMRKAIYFSPR